MPAAKLFLSSLVRVQEAFPGPGRWGSRAAPAASFPRAVHRQRQKSLN